MAYLDTTGLSTLWNKIKSVFTTKDQSIPYIVGSSSDSAGVWTGSYDGITSYKDGLTIIYVPQKAGISSGTTLNINGLGAKGCYINNNKMTTHFSANVPILLTYITQSGVGYWKCADYTSALSGMSISGTVNLTNGTFNTQNNSSLNSYTKVFGDMGVGEMRMYLVADSSGNLPSTSETAVTVPHNGVLSPAQVYFGKSQAFGVSVGDICVMFKKSALLNICRIIPLNDVKPANGDFPGADGLSTVWDKTRINKVDGIEWTANHVRDNYLPKNDRFPSRADWLINVDNCIDNGVYPTCDAASMNVGLYNQYITLIVQRTSTADNGGYHTIEQTAYGRGSDGGKVYKRIIFYKSDGTDTQYGSWIRQDTNFTLSYEYEYTLLILKIAGIPGSELAIPHATTELSGLMSTLDKIKLDNTYTKEEVNTKIGDINIILESIING